MTICRNRDRLTPSMSMISKPPDAFEMYGRFLGWTRRGVRDLSRNHGYFD
ncbi:hypothetical protein [Micromonospora sp. NPDC005299]